MNALDYTIIIILAVPFMTGVFKGFMRMLFGVLGVVGGFVLSIVFARPAGVFLGEHLGFDDPFIGKLLAFILIFFGCGVLGVLGGWLARKIMVSANMGFLDRLFGGVLGMLQGAVVCAVVLTVAYLLPSTQPWVDASVIGSNTVALTHTIGDKLPADWTVYLSPTRWIGESRSKILEVLEGSDSVTTPNSSTSNGAGHASDGENSAAAAKDNQPSQ